jgi:hypothetical protein
VVLHEIPNVTDIIEKSQSNIDKNPSDSEKQNNYLQQLEQLRQTTVPLVVPQQPALLHRALQPRKRLNFISQ